MKNLLPTSISLSVNKTKGFTLIELLVVIAIIAVLAVMGFAIFTGVATKGNDAKRQQDLKAIGDVLESNKKPTGYQPLFDTNFAGGTIPSDPLGSTNRAYCISSDIVTKAVIGGKPAPWIGINCPGAAPGAGINGKVFLTISTTTPVANTTGWMICATLTDETTVVCRTYAQ